jgi:hypothetical protein
VKVRALISLVAAAGLAGCGGGGPIERIQTAFEETRDPACYTVDLFTKPRFVTPGSDVPADMRAFAGVWGEGAWNGEWCHDLYVLEIKPDGAVKLIETHAPHAPWGKRATAFQRTARIDRDGRLRLRYGRVRTEYWVEDGTLYGVQDEAGDIRRIAMTRRDA